MNKNKLKTYAPRARNDFVAAVKARAALLGISEAGVSPATKTGDVVIVEGREWPTKVGVQRERLAGKIGKEGFEAIMDRVAYTWFNRFAALRFMELHDYLGHGHRVLSNREGGLPEILFHAGDVDLPGLNKAQVVELRLAGDRDGDLYRMLLVAQCNALSVAMPFLFERIDDESELLLPDNLLRTDSVIAKMVSSTDEEDWSEVEIIGWLYQYYISERKEQVIGGVVKSEDIPAATQLFTPNWVVKYLVQNSVGRLWLNANPESSLRSKWRYYTEAQGQGEAALQAMAAAIQTRTDCDGGRLNPESITVLDPACGSGHILVEIYEILKDIYLERGYQPKSIPRLILEKNAFGLDIDDRAAQLAGFALLMKARADDRRLFSETPVVHVRSLSDSKALPFDEIVGHLAPFGVDRGELTGLLAAFSEAKTLGSLITLPASVVLALPSIRRGVTAASISGDVFAQAAANDVIHLLEQADIISSNFDAVIANPPYMGGKGMNAVLKTFAKSAYPDSKSDLFAMFIERGFEWCKPSGFNSMVTMQSWMFLSSYEELRAKLLRNHSLMSMTHMDNGVMGIAFGTAATVFFKPHIPRLKGFFSYCEMADIGEQGVPVVFPVKNHRTVSSRPDDFEKIPGAPIAYWASDSLKEIFSKTQKLGSIAQTKQGLATTNNALFLRCWHEVSIKKVGFGFESIDDAFESGLKWFPLNKGGGFRRWYGNNEYVINFENKGKTICDYIDNTPGVNVKSNGRVINRDSYFKEGMTWSSLSSGGFSMRWSPKGSIFETKGAMCFPNDSANLFEILALFNSKLIDHFLLCLSPTVDYHEGPLKLVPARIFGSLKIIENTRRAIDIAKCEWDSFETSWDFSRLPFVVSEEKKLSCSWEAWAKSFEDDIASLRSIEEENNSFFIERYDLKGELDPAVSESEITLRRQDREADSKRLISYAIGCMMGRYSLDESGVIYADAGGVGFDPDRYKSFSADADGILPLTDELWFDDDSTLRVVEFLRAVWGRETSDENMEWVADSLGKKNGETAEETVRRYLSASFYKDHLQTYKKRPIYWLFSSGKQKAFEALVYLHRYHEGTLARMRSEYVVPLLSKYLDRIELLARDAEAAGSAAARTKIQKRIDALRKKHHELVAFEEKLRHMADSRIRLDLDDGVKVNYAKFGDLLAETKAVTGGAED